VIRGSVPYSSRRWPRVWRATWEPVRSRAWIPPSMYMAGLSSAGPVYPRPRGRPSVSEVRFVPEQPTRIHPARKHPPGKNAHPGTGVPVDFQGHLCLNALPLITALREKGWDRRSRRAPDPLTSRQSSDPDRDQAKWPHRKQGAEGQWAGQETSPGTPAVSGFLASPQISTLLCDPGRFRSLPMPV